MNEKEFCELSAARALGALSPEEEAEFVAALAEQPDRDELVALDEGVAAALAHAVEEVTPPPEIRANLLAAVSQLPQSGAQAPHEPGSRSSSGSDVVIRSIDSAADNTSDTAAIAAPGQPHRTKRIVLASLFALAAAAALITAISWGPNLWSGPTPEQLALQQIEEAPDVESASAAVAGGGTAEALWSAELGQAVLVSEDLPALSDDESYELWFVRGDTPISAGIFAVSDGHAMAPLSGEMHEGDIIAITVEVAGGSPTGNPTGDPIVAIETA